MRHVIAVVILTMTCTKIAAAQQRPLQAIDRPVIPGERRCLPYFAATTFGGATEEQIIFAYQSSDGSVKRDTIPKTRTVVRVADQQSPSYENIVVDGQSGALFRLPQSEYEKARDCLPQPKPATNAGR